jgi:hypothetical protein
VQPLHSFANALTPTTTLNLLRSQTRGLRTGVSNDPYEGAYPPMGSYVAPPQENKAKLYLGALAGGVAEPFKDVAKKGAGVVTGLKDDPINAAWIGLGGLGSYIVYRAFRKARALNGTLGLAALTGAVFYGAKTVSKATDDQDTTHYDGDWVKPLGTTLLFGISASKLLEKSDGDFRNPWDWFFAFLNAPLLRPRSIPEQVGKALGDSFHGIGKIPKATGSVFKDMTRPFRKVGRKVGPRLGFK